MSDENNKLVEEAPPEADAPPLSEGQDAPVLDAAEEEIAASTPEVDVEVEAAEEAEQSTAEQGEEAAESHEPVEDEEVAGGELEAEEPEEQDELEAEESEEQDEVEDEESEEEGVVETVESVSDEPTEMDWYILKVQSNRERSIADALRRKIAIEGLDNFFGEVIVPMEKVTEFKGGKKKVVERKLYPGYIVVHMHINDDTWFAVRETSGIGDFTGSGGKPTPMLPHEVARIVQTEEEETDEAPKLNIAFALGDRVKVKEGNFESFEGEVSVIDEHSGRITVMINIFGRSTPVELEYWQVDQV